jgi:hypothetical protein
MYPRPSSGTVSDSAAHPVVTHAQVARKLLQRAVRHLKYVENSDRSWQPEDNSRLIRQALERLAVAELLIDAYSRHVDARYDEHSEPASRKYPAMDYEPVEQQANELKAVD